MLARLILPFLVLPISAQTATNVQANTSQAAASPSSANQAPDEMTKKLTELVHAGKYEEAQQLTAGLLIAYPSDQRLIKAKALIEKMLSQVGQTFPGSGERAVNTHPGPLTGMDNVQLNSLIELARQAQQTTDLTEQKNLLHRFMDQSNPFLQKHPEQMLLWQLRAAAAISLNDSTAGYEAGRTLITLGAADSTDPNLQRLMAQLNNKGWLDAQTVQEAERNWILGTWSVSVSRSWPAGHNKKTKRSWDEGSETWSIGNVEFSRSGSIIEGRYISDDGVGSAEVHYRGTMLDSGEMHWEHQDVLHFSMQHGWATDPNGWTPATSFIPGENKKTMRMVFSSGPFTSIHGDTLIFTKK